ATQDLCSARGLSAYEVSNHAVSGAESRHNLIYWRYGDYAGIGPGAHGRLTLGGQRWAIDTPKAPGAWLDRVDQHGTGDNPWEALSAEDQAAEYLMMSLRLSEGSDLARFRNLGGTENNNKINNLVSEGLMVRSDDSITVTATGRMVLNAILREILA
ncbi:MAG: coproporphyrinogen III oxidase, partial [Paracoccaceae bacterium]|nr:coproporphyrinogen III oxidase [Paracoccaceae bacterium]